MKQLLPILGLVLWSIVGCRKEAPPPPSAPPTPPVVAATADAGVQIVFRDSAGRVLTDADLQKTDGKVRWEIVGPLNVPEEARFLHQRGRDEGARREYAKAAISFYEASKLAPDWPFPVYDAAYTYLLVGNTDKALELYSRTLELAPRGFFTALTAVDALTRERAGTLPTGLYREFLSMEFEKNPDKRLDHLQKLVARAPTFAPAWEKLSGELREEEGQVEAIDKGLAANPDPETKGFLLINRALHWKIHGRQQDAVNELGRLALDPASPLDVAEAAKAALAFALK